MRSEYPAAQRQLARAVEEARAAGLLGRSVLGSGFDFEVEVFPGYGGDVRGEETAPLDALEGLHGSPAVVDSVEALVNVPWIVERGAAAGRPRGWSGATRRRWPSRPRAGGTGGRGRLAWSRRRAQRTGGTP